MAIINSYKDLIGKAYLDMPNKDDDLIAHFWKKHRKYDKDAKVIGVKIHYLGDSDTFSWSLILEKEGNMIEMSIHRGKSLGKYHKIFHEFSAFLIYKAEEKNFSENDNFFDTKPGRISDFEELKYELEEEIAFANEKRHIMTEELRPIESILKNYYLKRQQNATDLLEKLDGLLK